MKIKSQFYLALVTLPFYLFLAACGGGSSSVPLPDTTGPTATPANGGVVTTGQRQLVINFNEEVFNAALGVPDTSNVILTLKGSNTLISGTPQKTQTNQITFYLDKTVSLVVNLDYELTLSNIFDGAKNPLQTDNAANYVWSFQVRDYQTLKINSGLNSVVQQPQYTTNASNEVLAAWVEKSDTDYFLYSSIFNNNNWSAPQLIDTTPVLIRLNDVSSNGLGFAIAWTNDSNIYASVYSNGGWQNSDQLNINAASSAVLASTYHPTTSTTINIVGEGYAIAWQETKPATLNSSPYASIFNNSQWGTSTAIGTGTVTTALRIASNGRGYALVWTGNDPSTSCIRGNQVFADIYSSTKGYWINTKNNNPTIISAGPETLTLDTTKDAFNSNVISNGDSYMFHWYGGDQDNGSYVYSSVFTQLLINDITNTETLEFDGPYKISNNGNVTNIQAVSNGKSYAVSWAANGVSNAPNPSGFYIFMNQYTYQPANSFVGQWALPLVINNPATTTTVSSVTIAANTKSYAMVWNQSDSDGGFSLYGRVLSMSNKAWSDSAKLSKTNLGKIQGKPTISSFGDRYSVLWLQSRNASTGSNDVYLNQFNGASWQTTATQVSSTPISSAQENTTLLNVSTTLLALWTQNDPAQANAQQIYSKQLLHRAPATVAITPIQPVPTAIKGTNVGPSTNYVYVTNIADNIATPITTASMAVFKSDNILKTLIAIDANTTTPVIDNYPITTESVMAMDNLGQTLFVTNKSGRLIAYAVDKISGALTQTSSIAVGTQNNNAIASHPNGFIYVLYRPTITGNIGSVSAFRYGLQGKTLTSISLNSRVTNSVVAVQAQPVDMVIHPSGRYLYVINQSTNKAKVDPNIKDNGSISIFSINPSTGELTEIIHFDLAQAGLSVIPGDVVLSPDGNFLYLGDQFVSIVRFKINSDGSLTVNPATDKFTEGVITNPRNITVAPSGKYLYHLGTNKIYTHIIKPSTGALTPIFNLSSGYGYGYGETTNADRANILNQVRGLAISSDGKQLYVADKISSNTAAAGLYVFNVQQTTNNAFEILTGGLYTPGQLVPNNSVPNGHTIISSKVGRCQTQRLP